MEPAGAGLVQLAAANVTGGLTDDLAITVDRGTSGRYGDCTGFTGSRIYTGTLTSLAAVPAGVATGWQPRTAGAGRSGSP
jgi:hypothetical protein